MAHQAATQYNDEGEPSTSGRPLLSVAPMMDWTDVHYRQMARFITRRAWLWTEMVVDKTILHSPYLDKFLWFPPEQRPIVFQLGGSDPDSLHQAARKISEYGYDEINLNCGCPSDRVAGAGCFGASLMLEPQLVARCMVAIAEGAPGVSVTVKCRLGVDQVDSYEAMRHFVQVVSAGSPVRHFIIHARKCLLKGLNPHQNRTVPPLRYAWVYALKHEFPHLQFSLNGGVQSTYEACAFLNHTGPFMLPSDPDLPSPGQAPLVNAYQPAPGRPTGCMGDGFGAHGGGEGGQGQEGRWIEGVMIGRQAYNDPWNVLGDADRAVFGEPSNAAASRRQVLARYERYAEEVQRRWSVLHEDGRVDPSVRTLMKPLLNLFHGEPGSKKWKAELDLLLRQEPLSVSDVLARSLHLLPDHVLDALPRQGPLPELAQRSVISMATPAPVPLYRFPRPEDRAGDKKRSDVVVQEQGDPSAESAGAAENGAQPETAVADKPLEGRVGQDGSPDACCAARPHAGEAPASDRHHAMANGGYHTSDSAVAAAVKQEDGSQPVEVLAVHL